ncbi:MAG: hypothetical protein QNL04_01020 [SAR324 cluster bacterium]|nr:hypothetical protein [SAR324 cluster bacterium]
MLQKKIIFTALIVSLFTTPLFAKIINYEQFFAKGENFYLLQPNLVADFFTGLAEFKGRRNKSLYKVTKEVLGCPVGIKSSSNCPVDRFRLLKKERRTPSDFKAHVNWTVVERVKRGRFHVLSLTWRPELIETEILFMEDYLKGLNVARESVYYQIPEQIKRVQFSPHFQRRIQIKVDAKMAAVLLELYEEKPEDFRDVITFVAEGNSVTLRDDLATFNLFLKAKKITINHLDFPAMSVPEAKGRK